jgi:hypothetical protein
VYHLYAIPKVCLVSPSLKRDFKVSRLPSLLKKLLYACVFVTKVNAITIFFNYDYMCIHWHIVHANISLLLLNANINRNIWFRNTSILQPIQANGMLHMPLFGELQLRVGF